MQNNDENFKDKKWGHSEEFCPSNCAEHQIDIYNLQKNERELWEMFETEREKLEAQKSEISNLKNTVYGIDGQNGLLGKSKNFQIFVDKITPDHEKLMAKLQEFHEFKKSLGKIFFIVLGTALISIVTNLTKIKSDDSKVQALQNIQSEVSKILQEKLKEAATHPGEK